MVKSPVCNLPNSASTVAARILSRRKTTEESAATGTKPKKPAVARKCALPSLDETSGQTASATTSTTVGRKSAGNSSHIQSIDCDFNHIQLLFNNFMAEMAYKFNNLSLDVAAAIAKIEVFVTEKEVLLTDHAVAIKRIESLSEELCQVKSRLSALEGTAVTTNVRVAESSLLSSVHQRRNTALTNGERMNALALNGCFSHT